MKLFPKQGLPATLGRRRTAVSKALSLLLVTSVYTASSFALTPAMDTSSVVWRNNQSGQNWVHQFEGYQSVLSQPFSLIADANWQVAADGDFNGDGKGDVLWRHAVSGVNWLYLTDGVKVTESKRVNEVNDLNWQVAGVGDFNNDGNDDILWRHSTSGDNYIYYMDGSRIVSTQFFNKIADQNWQVAGVGDLNADGTDDLVWRNSATGANWAYMVNNGKISQSKQINTVAGSDWHILGFEDFNGDAIDDILWRNASTGHIFLYTMSGATISAAKLIGRAPAEWRIEIIADRNGDKKADILWRNANSGVVWSYAMDGSQVVESIDTGLRIGIEWDAVAALVSTTTAVTPIDFEIEPITAVVQQVGQCIDLDATAYFSNGTSQLNPDGINWSCDGGVFTINNQGNACAQAAGTAVCSATWQSFVDSVSLTAEEMPIAPVSFAITNGPFSLNVGETAQVQTLGTFSDQTSQANPTASWSCDSNQVSISSTGLISAIGEVTTQCRGQWEGFSDSVSVTVTDIGPFDKWYFRGTPNNWVATEMQTTDGVIYCTTQTFGNVEPRFKVDHLGDWTENYPEEDYVVDGGKTYDICFDAVEKTFDVKDANDEDTEAPVLSSNPVAGNYEAVTLSVTLIAQDKDPDAKIYYTVDESTPTLQSTPYTQPIPITDKGDGIVDATIKAIGIDDAGNQSQVYEFAFRLNEDGTPPEVEANPPAGRSETPVSVTLIATDLVDPDPVLHFTTDGSAATKSSPEYAGQVITIAKTTTINVLAVDSAGNEKSASFTYTIGGNQNPSDYYAANPNGQVGMNKTITSLADWSETMIVAQGAANDAPRSWMGFHEYPDPDLYALYAAWDDNNLYLMVEIPNIDQADTIDNDKSYAGSQFLPMGWAINTGKRVAGTGVMDSGASVWQATEVFSFDNGGIDTLIMHHPRLNVGTPGLFLTDPNGFFSYDKEFCLPFEDEETGVVRVQRDVYFNESVSTSMWAGVNDDGSFGGKVSTDLGSYTYVDLKADGITASAYQLTVSLDALGIDKAYLESNGIGIAVFSTYGESMMDILPYDVSMHDNVLEPYSGANDGTSEEKADFDSISAPLARIGKL